MTQNARLTVDLPRDTHKLLKMAAAQLGISMKDFLLISAFEKLQELEDEWFVQEAEKVLKAIQAGNEKTISLESMKRRLKK